MTFINASSDSDIPYITKYGGSIITVTFTKMGGALLIVKQQSRCCRWYQPISMPTQHYEGEIYNYSSTLSLEELG